MLINSLLVASEDPFVVKGFMLLQSLRIYFNQVTILCVLAKTVAQGQVCSTGSNAQSV